MTLFFETGNQAVCFLVMLPAGLLTAFMLDIRLRSPYIRPLADVLILLAAGITLLYAVVLCREPVFRLYHLLGLCAGAVLYMQGIGKITAHFRRRQDLKRRASK